MWENLVGRHIRRCNRNLFFVNAVILVALLVWGYSSKCYLYNCFKGPFPTTHDALVKIADASVLQRYFVSVNHLEPLGTGLQYVETTKDKYTQEVKSQKITATYFAASLGEDRFLIIKSPASKPASRYDGSLTVVPGDVRAYFQKELLDSKERKFEEVFVPYLLDAETFRSQAYWGFLFAVPLGALAAFNIYKAINRFSNIEVSPIFTSLKRFNQPPAITADMIQQEVNTSGDLSPVRSVCVTSSWFLRKSLFGLAVLHWTEIVWIYQKVTSHYYQCVPTGKTYALIVGDVYGRRIEVEVGRWKAKDATTRLLSLLASNLPWVVAGYTEDLKTEYEKNRAGFIAAVQERQKQYSR
jgi:hypothetical protein